MTNEQLAALLMFLGSRLENEIDDLAKLLPDDMPKDQDELVCLNGLYEFKHELFKMYKALTRKHL
jgi:hypothetical protein